METFSIFSLIAVLVLIIITFIAGRCRRKLSYWSSLGIEQLPNPHWFFGHTKEGILFKASAGWHLGQLYKRDLNNAPFVGFYIFHKPCLLLKDPKIIKRILTKDFNNFTDRHFAGTTQKDSIGLRNLFAVRGPEWKYMKQKMGPMLNNSMSQYLELMMETGGPMLQFMESQEGKQIDAQDLSLKFTSDLIANVALGTKIDSFSDPDGELPQFLSNYFYGFSRMLALVSVFFMPDLVDRTGSLLFFNSKFIRKVFWTAMEARQNSGETRGDFIDFAIKMQNEPRNPLYEFSGDNLIHQAGTFFSGFESSGTTAAFTLMQLARHKTYQDQARADVRRAVEKHGWTYEGILEMKFLKQCVSEALRMHPQISTLDRIGKEDYEIPGSDFTIKKGTAIYISIYGLHEDPQHFEDPGTFDPGRFEEGKVIPEAYIPFGFGPRMCLGTKLGYLHTTAFVAMVLSRFELYQKLEETFDLDARSTFTAAANGLMVECRNLTDEEIINLP